MHYVIVLDRDTEDNHDVDIIGVAHSMEEADKIFKEQRAIEEEIVAENDWLVYVDCDGMYEAIPKNLLHAGHTKLWIQGVIE